ncbi:MAG TPA: hypothetical protein PLQ11_08005 [Beijerinckiaceae bacterium]|nr:hypothetical protein [Beijerinckiaceae bacterium]
MTDPVTSQPATALRASRITDAPIGSVREPVGVRWLMVLISFMRIAALYWLAKGLLHWAYIIGLADPGFGDLRLSRQGLVMGLAVADLVAGVGLWMGASWGAAVWIVVLFVEGSAPFLFPDMGFSMLDPVVALLAGALYLAFAWAARREQHAAYH